MAIERIEGIISAISWGRLLQALNISDYIAFCSRVRLQTNKWLHFTRFLHAHDAIYKLPTHSSSFAWWAWHWVYIRRIMAFRPISQSFTSSFLPLISPIMPHRHTYLNFTISNFAIQDYTLRKLAAFTGSRFEDYHHSQHVSSASSYFIFMISQSSALR
jgi:hypothetical protein